LQVLLAYMRIKTQMRYRGCMRINTRCIKVLKPENVTDRIHTNEVKSNV